MGCFSCFKSPPSVDSSEEEYDLALQVSRYEADVQEDEQLALAMEVSSREVEEERRRTKMIEEEERRRSKAEEEERRRTRMIEEERRRTRMIEEERKRIRAIEEERRRTRMIEEERRRTRMIEEERQRTRAILEERRRTRAIEEEKRRRTRMMEEDAQIANGFLYEDRERQINHNSALEDEQLSKAIAKSLKEKDKRKQFEGQVKKDEQLALNMENQKSISQLDEDEQVAKAIKKSLKVKGKGKQFEDEQVKNDEKIAAIYQESLNNMVDSPPRLAEIKNISASAPLDEDEQLEKVIRESLKGKGLIEQSKDDEVEDDGNLPMVNPPRSMCGGCNSEIEHVRSVDVLGVPWHPQCLWCDACDKSIAIHEMKTHVSNSRGRYHKSCYERYCYVCKEKKLKAYHEHHFWKERYCPVHDTDGTHKCCSCERLEPRGTNYVMLGDSRRLCLECMDSAVMDTYEVQPLHFEIREYFEGLNMKIEKEFPFFLVEKQALNAAEKEEKIDNHYELVTRGICLSEAQTVTSVSKGPRMLPNNQLTGMATESQRVVRECEVTAILILYGLPRLLTGYILAHEMMHAYLRLNGHRIVNNVMEEGICQVLGHMWLESQTYAAIDDAASSSASTSRTPAAASESKKGECSDFEKKFVEFCKNQIEEDDSPVYGLGFKKVYKMVSNSSLPEALKEIIRRG